MKIYLDNYFNSELFKEEKSVDIISISFCKYGFGITLLNLAVWVYFR